MASSTPAPPPSPDLKLDDLTQFLNLKTVPANPPNKAGTDSAGDLEQKWKLFEKRFQYAWDFFDFHATQRTTMFNFFLVFVGFIFAGYASLLKDAPFPLAMVVALVGAVLTFIFIFLDRRNEELVHIAEAVLESLESDVLFDGYKRKIRWPMRRKWVSMDEKLTERQVGILLRQTIDEDSINPRTGKKLGQSRYRHGRWIPIFQVAIMVLFVGLAIFSGLQWKATDFHHTFPMGPGINR